MVDLNTPFRPQACTEGQSRECSEQGHPSKLTRAWQSGVQSQVQLRSAAAQSWEPASGAPLSSLEQLSVARTQGVQTSKQLKPSPQPLIFNQQESQSRNVGCLNYFFNLRKG